MLRSHLEDAAVAAAKEWGHPAVESRHVAWAIVRHLGDHPEVAARKGEARARLDPRGSSIVVPVPDGAARAMLDGIDDDASALAALTAFLASPPGATGAPARDAPPPEAPAAGGPAPGTETSARAEREEATPVAASTASPPETVADVLAELDALVGLEAVKNQVRRVVAVVQANQTRAGAGLPTVNPGLHLVFTGAPGTGKTTVARIVARLYAASGALPGSNFTEVDRSDLVAGYVGQTAPRTLDVIRKTRPGVLFIDEAYALTPTHESDFGGEAIATLVKAMEDHREELAVIVAGYRAQMADFVESNPGLRSRFKTFIDFPDYAPAELGQIFVGYVDSVGLRLGPGAREKAEDLFEAAVNRADFGNARFARSLFEQAYSRMAERAAADGAVEVNELLELLPDDLDWTETSLDAERRRIGFTPADAGEDNPVP